MLQTIPAQLQKLFSTADPAFLRKATFTLEEAALEAGVLLEPELEPLLLPLQPAKDRINAEAHNTRPIFLNLTMIISSYIFGASAP